MLLCGSINTAKAQCWQSVSAGEYHTLAIKQDGTLWAWGGNSSGQLGDGTNVDKNIPVQIGFASNCQSINVGYYHTLAIKQDDTLWAWGNNPSGQLGDGTFTNKNTPTQIGTATNWQSIRAGGYHSLAIKQDGTAWAWGYNQLGQLGDGTNTNKNTPIQIGSASNWQSIRAGGYHSLAIKQDGTAWAWGGNSSGQLGDGTNTNINTPTQIGGSCSPLPIKLLSFTASLQNTNNAKLQWKIATAEEGGKYVLLRCTDGRSFLPINLQTGNATLTQFGYIDTALPNGFYYYRLKMMDKDGKVTHSNVAIVKVGGKEQSVAVYPNPVKRGEILQLGLQNITAIQIEIINAVGQVVYSNSAKQTGSIGISISSLLTPGQYIVRIVSEDKVHTQKLLIKQ